MKGLLLCATLLLNLWPAISQGKWLDDAQLRKAYQNLKTAEVKLQWCEQDAKEMANDFALLDIEFGKAKTRLNDLEAANALIQADNERLIAERATIQAKRPVLIKIGGGIGNTTVLDKASFKGGLGIQLRNGSEVRGEFDSRSVIWVSYYVSVFKIN